MNYKALFLAACLSAAPGCAIQIGRITIDTDPVSRRPVVTIEDGLYRNSLSTEASSEDPFYRKGQNPF